MRMVPGYVELVEILMACAYADKESYFDSVSEDLGVDFKPGEELELFLRFLRDDSNWSIKVAVNVFSEIKDSVIFFCDMPPSSGKIVTIEETMESLKNDFRGKARCVVESILLNNLNFSKEEVERALGGDLNIVAEAVDRASDLSENTTWFITQLVNFPQQSQEILMFALTVLKKYYEDSGLRKKNLGCINETIESFGQEEYKEVASGFLELYGVTARDESPLYLLLQNTLQYPGVRYAYACDTQFVVLNNQLKQLQALVNPYITDHILRLFLKNFSDPTKMQIMVAVSQEPRYVDELAKLLGLSKATISYHLSSLGELALVTGRKDRRRIYFSLNRKRIESIIKRLEVFYEESDDSWK